MDEAEARRAKRGRRNAYRVEHAQDGGKLFLKNLAVWFLKLCRGPTRLAPSGRYQVAARGLTACT
ncbi:MAG: hypothetical protein Ct9H300mP11_24020 [Chloroflexota bacterium]|nr:MAG: hypothetical protein Ct9H300mP11_24020 [Chloroflexota bacterium]